MTRSQAEAGGRRGDVGSSLSDKIVSSNETKFGDGIIYGKGFGGITDIEIGPEDGFLYVLTFNNGNGTIYRITPNDRNIT